MREGKGDVVELTSYFLGGEDYLVGDRESFVLSREVLGFSNIS